jgi:hypothetical protein
MHAWFIGGTDENNQHTGRVIVIETISSIGLIGNTVSVILKCGITLNTNRPSNAEAKETFDTLAQMVKELALEHKPTPQQQEHEHGGT